VAKELVHHEPGQARLRSTPRQQPIQRDRGQGTERRIRRDPRRAWSLGLRHVLGGRVGPAVDIRHTDRVDFFPERTPHTRRRLEPGRRVHGSLQTRRAQDVGPTVLERDGIAVPGRCTRVSETVAENDRPETVRLIPVRAAISGVRQQALRQRRAQTDSVERHQRRRLAPETGKQNTTGE